MSIAVRSRSQKFSGLHRPIATGECILMFSPPVSLGDDFSPPPLGKKKPPLLESFARLGLTCSFAAYDVGRMHAIAQCL